MENKFKCENCQRELNIGADAIKIEDGVIGTRGFIPLKENQYFCCDKCLGEYYGVSDLPSLPPRIP